ncbi:hypothetical protein Neosp_002883 [[Neocosmospora] mangrovei]
MAMKVVDARGVEGEEYHLKKLKNEVEILAQSRHAHIVEFLTSEGWSRSEVRIFMSLKEGSLASLVETHSHYSIQDIYKTVLHHMLQALDYLARQGIVHRDMKPDNILYSTVQGGYHFQLGDFGLAAEAMSSQGFYGTPVFMAPEVIYGEIQTPKLDVWSLYLTIVWVLDDQNFRQRCLTLEYNRGPDRLFQGIWTLVWPVPTRLGHLQAMVSANASNRASAGDMLQQLYQGRGRPTPNVGPPPEDRAPRRERHREERPRHHEIHRDDRRHQERPRHERHREERYQRQERAREPSPFNMDNLEWAIGIDIAAQRRELERYNAAMGLNDEPRWPEGRALDRAANRFADDPEELDFGGLMIGRRRRMDLYPGAFDPFGPQRRYM